MESIWGINMNDRTIIGANEISGCPISAPDLVSDGKGDFGMPPMRWRYHENDTFVLECYCQLTGRWKEVPLWKPS